MKKYALLVLAVALTLNVQLFSQNKNKNKTSGTEVTGTQSTEKNNSEKRVNRMVKDLSLTMEQKNQLIQLFDNKELKGKERDSELKKIIGDDKFAQYHKLKEERKNKNDNSDSKKKKVIKDSSEE